MTSPAAFGKCHYLSLHEYSGYATAARRCMLALVDAGVDVTWVPFSPSPAWGLSYAPCAAGDVGDGDLSALLRGPTSAPPETVIVHLPPEYFPVARDRYGDSFLVGHTVWETDRLPGHWSALLDVPDLLIVPCQWNADVIAAAGVATPTVVVPHAAGAVVAGTGESWGGIAPETFVFYSIGTWIPRKAMASTVAAYLEAFTAADPVLLVVKTTHRDFTHRGHRSAGRIGPGTSAWAVAQVVKRYVNPAPILLVTGDLPESEIAALHTRGNCFVSLCHSEGWGVGCFDAATYANPVVITGFGGHHDYLDRSKAYLVDFDLIHVDDRVAGVSYTPDQIWADASIADGTRLLREVFTDSISATKRAAQLAADIRWRYRPSAIAEAVIDAVGSHR